MTKEEMKAKGVPEDVIEDIFKNYVPKTQFNEKLNELKELRGDQANLSQQLNQLKEANKNNEDLKAQIEKIQAEREAAEQALQEKLVATQKEGIIERALMGAKAKNNKAVKALLDADKFELEGDKLKGLEEQLQEVIKENPYLFGDPKKDGFVPSGTPKPEGSEPTDVDKAKEEFTKALGLI